MKQSIETVWKKGFLDSDALVAPKLNGLYEKKSIHLIDKFNRMFRINLILIAVFSFVPLIWFYFKGVPITGVMIFVLLNWLGVIGVKELKTLKEIDINKSSYHYLKAFDSWMKDKIKTYTRVYRIFYPLFFLSFVIGFWFSEYRDEILVEIVGDIPNASMLFGVPTVFVVIVTVMTLLIAASGGALYRLDLNLVYGRVIKRLDEMVSDLEELRGE